MPFPALPQGVAVFDSERRLVYWNAAFAEILTGGEPVRPGLTIEECMAMLPPNTVSPSPSFGINIPNHPEQSPSGVLHRWLPGGGQVGITFSPMADGGFVALTIHYTKEQLQAAENPDSVSDRNLSKVVSLEDHERLLKILFDRKDIACCLLDADDYFLAWNERYLEMWPEERGFVGRNYNYRDSLRRWLETELSPEEMPNLERHLAVDVKRNREAVDGYTYQRRDGRWIFAHPHIFSDGRLLKIWSDVTPVIAKDAKIERISEMLVDASIGFIQFDERGRFILANRKLHEFFPETQTSFQENFSYAKHLEYIKASLVESEHARLDTLIARTDIINNLVMEPMVFRCRDGRWLQLQERSNIDGGIVSMWMDISSQVRAAAETASLRSQLLVAIRNMSEGFALFAPDDSLIVCNDQYRALMGARCPFGVSYKAILDDSHFDLNARAAMIEQHLNAQVIELPLADGRWMRVLSRETDDGGRISIVDDVTQRKQTEIAIRAAKEAAEAASRAKSEFLANMSHELRTPLNAIIGFSDVLRNQRLGPIGTSAYLDYGEYILRSGRQLLEIINNILDLSKIEAGHFELREEPVAVNELVKACQQVIFGRAIEGDLLLEFKIDPDLPLLVADPQAMKQCILNLLSNAVKFTKRGGRVLVRAGLITDSELAIAVRDTGIGIAEKDIEKIVMPFGQVEHSLNRQHEGVGLGLPLTKKLIERHGGRLVIASKLGVGTTATLILPAQRLKWQ